MSKQQYEEYMRKRGAQFPPAVLPGKAPQTPARACHKAGEMNKTEAAYAEYLEARKRAGHIREYAFEPEKFKLGEKCFYTPDFRVVMPDGTVELHEVKGHWEDDARVKVKVAAALHPYIFRAVRREKGQWVFETFTKTEGGEA